MGTVDVVVIAAAPRDMVGRNQETVKVLFCGHYWTQVVKMSKDRSSSGSCVACLEVSNNALFDYIERVLGDLVEVLSYSTQDSRGDIGHGVSDKVPTTHLDG